MTPDVTVHGTYVSVNFDIETAYRCTECDELSLETSGAPLYECGECSEIFNRNNGANDNNQCPSCNKFASKLADDSCSECEAGEVEEESVVVVDDELIPVDEIGERLVVQ